MAPYPWSRQRYWSESRLSQQHRLKPFPRHTLLGTLMDSSNHDICPTWRNVLRIDDVPWLRDHQMMGLTTFPLAGYVSMAVEAAAQRAKLRGVSAPERFMMRDVQAIRPLLLSDGSEYELMTSVAAYAEVSRVGKDLSHLVYGDRVCAMTKGAYSTFVRCAATSVARIPDSMAFEEAASVPVVYSTAYYGLIELAGLAAGGKVLIHAAAGGVGQAVIQLAKMVGAEVFATVGSPEKKTLIMERYGIPEDRIWSSRDISFGPDIHKATSSVGVDVVLNSLAGDYLRETWECIAPFGRFIEVDKRNITSNTRLEMAMFDRNVTFSSVDLTLVAAERPVTMARTLNAVMALVTARVLRPIGPITVFGLGEIEKAFRLLQSGKTMAPSRGGWWHMCGRIDGAVADLVNNLQRTAPKANITVKACDVADARSVAHLVAQCEEELPPIRGCIHAAMVLRDVLFEKMTHYDYSEVVRPKVSGEWNMHMALASAALDFFIVLSSVAGIIGNRGQAAYAAANTSLDVLARHRQRLGLPGTSLALTAVQDVGYLAEGGAGRQVAVMHNLGGGISFTRA
ncbi:KR domain-containing protein [Corynascus novoguineensis]|uniref:KR domain-containing protein n=1 Tax=Corynascus novoguineensis TaxID=1126955 RepID=A0AAN7HK93_9PEZI|nr:KR domain-containing protein [Corynascus novoguineensis]